MPNTGAALREVTGDQLATIIYTSGTTGEPKGVMLNHSNLSSNSIDSLKEYVFYPEDVALEFLPLAHVYERTVGYGYLLRGVSIAYLEQIEAVAEALLEVHPTMTAAVPRFFEKLYANILEKGHRETGLKRKIFDWALGVAQESVPWRAYGKKAEPRSAISVENCGPAGLFENSRGDGRPDSDVLFRRSAAGAGACGIFLVGGCARVIRAMA